MLRRWLVLALVLFAVVLLPHNQARADLSVAHGVPVTVLAFDSEDAEEQADALTAALRSRVRAAQGWSLVETSQSLGMLTAALRCPTRPLTADCEEKIADQLKADRYIFGYVIKGPLPSQVTAEIHLYQRGKPDTVIRESYADNLKDQNDDTLRKIADRALERLGASAVGTLVVRMGSESGAVIVDGVARTPLERGTARIELAPGGHSVEVEIAGKAPQRRNVLVAAGEETVVDLSVVDAAPVEASDAPLPTRTIVGGGLSVLGVGGGIFAAVMLAGYFEAKQRGEDYQASPGAPNPEDPKLPAGQDADRACGSGVLPSNSTICKANDDTAARSTAFWIAAPISAALIAAGVYLLVTDGGGDEKSATNARARRPRVGAAPTIGAGSAGFVLSGSF